VRVNWDSIAVDSKAPRQNLRSTNRGLGVVSCAVPNTTSFQPAQGWGLISEGLHELYSSVHRLVLEWFVGLMSSSA
jgi:hypothetical protein